MKVGAAPPFRVVIGTDGQGSGNHILNVLIHVQGDPEVGGGDNALRITQCARRARRITCTSAFHASVLEFFHRDVDKLQWRYTERAQGLIINMLQETTPLSCRSNVKIARESLALIPGRRPGIEARESLSPDLRGSGSRD